MSEKQCSPCKDGYDIFCKLIFLASALGGRHSLGVTMSEEECFGIERMLREIAYEICPEEKPSRDQE